MARLDKSGKSPVKRIDLRIPEHIFAEIEKLAEETNQPFHSEKSTGKGRIVTPVILNLVVRGLEDIRKGKINPEAIASKNSLIVSEIEATVIKKIEATIEAKIAEAVKVAINNPLIETPEATATIAEDSEAIIVPTNETQEITPEVIAEDSEAIPEANETQESRLEATIAEETEAVIVPTNETQEVTAIKSYDEAIIFIKEQTAKKVNPTAIAKMMNEKFYTARKKTNWTNTTVERIIKSPKSKK